MTYDLYEFQNFENFKTNRYPNYLFVAFLNFPSMLISIHVWRHFFDTHG